MAFADRLSDRYPQPQGGADRHRAVLRDGVSRVLNEITDEMLEHAARDEEHLELLRGVGMRAALTVPMSSAGVTVGALSLVSAESARRFTAADLELAEELARRAGTAVENARLYTERSHIARTLQTELLPGQAAARCRAGASRRCTGPPATRTGSAATSTTRSRSAAAGLRSSATSPAAAPRRRRSPPSPATPCAPRRSCSTTRSMRSRRSTRELRARAQMSLCSVAAVLLREDDGRATAEIVCAGHPLPLLARDGSARAGRPLLADLGAYAGRLERTIVELEPGDVLVLYTDGVFDAVGEGGRFGEDRLQRTRRGRRRRARRCRRGSTHALSAFEIGGQADDTAVLAVERVGAVGAPAGARGDRVREDRPEL